PRMPLYGPAGQRRIAPPLVFGMGVLWHLLRHGRRYDVVHTAAFPYFSLLAAGLLRPLWGYALVADWFEFWSKAYWRDYLGGLGGRIGWLVQSLCLRVPQHAFSFARMTEARLRAHGLRGPASVLVGLCAGPRDRREPRDADPLVVFAGRHIPEKRVPAIVPAIEVARRRIPDLKACIFGSGPERPAVLAAIRERGLESVITAPGFAPAEAVEEALSRAMCMLLPSSREGYGLVDVEASSAGTPSVLVRGEDNAATELVEEGVNGVVAPTACPEDLAQAIVRIHEAGRPLRVSTADWFARNSRRLSVDSSLDQVASAYAGSGAAAFRAPANPGALPSGERPV
ncbi:MAG: glycosyltransferase, partial [Acetobacteraceae bacterium]|nr:glycosyltransferase [Acetobacteraceae bacterium]